MIGVHSPEFELEKDLDNVRRAVKNMGIVYPVAVDSDHAVWRAFNNEYWPALYLVDAKGHIRYHQFGEGEYERTEKVIAQLLRSGATDVSRARKGRSLSGGGGHWAASSPARTTSATSAPRTSSPPAARLGTRPGSTPTRPD